MPEPDVSASAPEPSASPSTPQSPEEDPNPPPGILMTHTSRTVQAIPEVNRTTASSIFPNGVPTNLDAIRPIISQAYSNSMSLTSWLNARFPGQTNYVAQPPQAITSPPTDSFVINLNDEPSTPLPQPQNPPHSHHEHHVHIQRSTAADNFYNNIREASTNAVNSNNSIISNSNGNNHESVNDSGDPSVDSLPMRPEAQELFKTIQNHLPFAALLLTKAIYDHRSGTLCLAVLLVAFVKANNDLKKEIAKQASKSGKSLFHILCYAFGALAMTSLVLDNYWFFISLEFRSFWDLLWGNIITDFAVKLSTVAVKTLLTCLPGSILPFQKRGKYYLFIEALSQLYRSVIPIYSWMPFFRQSYHGSEVVIGIIMASLYGVIKIREFLVRGKLLVNAFIKFWQNVSLGSPPSKEQLAASGGTCVICHEEYSTPVQLHCKHIFCEPCVSIWLDRERTCPLCRSPITDDPIYRDGHTTHFIQFY
ncbi:RING finger and transmembrane domain-containing protein 1 isoform X2 [Fopius arisanus]|uniref:RING finger and transmembrane domain-containing protein 1 isoform X2 n=1 Tax=Fopius arisanus TaxID=64838 RepID=A0A0C9R132_9HYME|nr:PREDICTED: RING finger and transmembrane domain-containing protein 1-like isoform X2 [Fopius arisanus]